MRGSDALFPNDFGEHLFLLMPEGQLATNIADIETVQSTKTVQTPVYAVSLNQLDNVWQNPECSPPGLRVNNMSRTEAGILWNFIMTYMAVHRILSLACAALWRIFLKLVGFLFFSRICSPPKLYNLAS